MILVTGAAGFIGSNLALALQEAGEPITLVDHPLTRIKAANFAGLRQFEFLEHSQLHEQLDRIKPMAVYHLGACSATTEQNWNYLLENNIKYTQWLWNHCTERQVPFIYASSAATYGDGSRGFDDATPPSTLTPLNLYGKSKNDFDIWALAQSKTPPRWAGVKFFNVYGPRELHKGRMASVVLQTWKQIRATGGMKLFRSTDARYADGGQLRDFVFVQDCVRHLMWLGTHDHVGGLFNSGTAAARSFLDLAHAVFAALKLPPNISFIDMPPDLVQQYQNYTQAVMTKLRSAGSDTPTTSLEAGVKQTVDWLNAYAE